jgi:hypothetical protein
MARPIISSLHHKIIINMRKSHLYDFKMRCPASKAASLNFIPRTNMTPILNTASMGPPAAPRAARHWRRHAQASRLHRARTSALALGITSNLWLPFSRAIQAWVLPHKAVTPGIIALTNRWELATPFSQVILMPWRTKGKAPSCMLAEKGWWTLLILQSNIWGRSASEVGSNQKRRKEQLIPTRVASTEK